VSRGFQRSSPHPDQGLWSLRHDVLPRGGLAAETSRSRSGRALSRSQSSAARSSRLLRGPRSAKSRSVSSTAHASMYRSSWSRSSSGRLMTISSVPRARSAARCRDTQSHCRQRWLQNSRGRPGPERRSRTRRHHRHRSPFTRCASCFVMTKTLAGTRPARLAPHTGRIARVGDRLGA